MRSRGFALVIVLWTLVLLSFLITHMVTTGRTETRIAANLVANAEAEAQAEGAVTETVFRLIDGSDGHWNVEDGPHMLRLQRATATVTIRAESGKVNPNAAPFELMAALLVACGAEQTQAGPLAAAILDWREPGDRPRMGGAKLPQYRAAGLNYAPPNAQFESLDEIRRVIGMTPDLFRRLKPHLSLYQQGDPDPRIADPIVTAALKSLPTKPSARNTDGLLARTVSITAQVTTESGGHFLRHAVVRLEPPVTQNYAILAWDTDAETE
ncbi:MAG: putative ral secretion pathway protein [Rhodospirillales bacterium]|nr:putative ral secretion pathway protein [Rhodospirillales bacterium]